MNKINTCILPAAGFGTRFLPATKSMPKELIPILNKPLIHYAVEEALLSHIKNMVIVYGKHKTAIPNYFDSYYELEHLLKQTNKEALLQEINDIMQKANFIYTRQPQMLGLGHAVLITEPIVSDDYFAVHLADDLCYNPADPVLSQLIDIHQKYGKSVVAVEEVPMEAISNYGVIDAVEIEPNIYKVNATVEKPKMNEAPSNLAIIGRYILSKEIFEKLAEVKPDAKGEIQLTTAINMLAMEGKVLAYKFKGRRFDCGSIKGFVDATNFFYENPT